MSVSSKQLEEIMANHRKLAWVSTFFRNAKLHDASPGKKMLHHPRFQLFVSGGILQAATI
jgi:hypothetical protein